MKTERRRGLRPLVSGIDTPALMPLFGDDRPAPVEAIPRARPARPLPDFVRGLMLGFVVGVCLVMLVLH